MTGEQASEVYFSSPGAPYPSMPMPATHYVTSIAALQSSEDVPSVIPDYTTATIVNRHNQMHGYSPTAGRISYPTRTPQIYDSPDSSKFQEWLVGPQPNYVLNGFLYGAGYPAATVMNGGKHNLALSTRVDQLTTRSSGGPGPAMMRPMPKFRRVQTIPRFSTMPQAYQTESAPG